MAQPWFRRAVDCLTLRFHDVRHTAVSLFLALGALSHVVREIADHSESKVTMTVYGDADELSITRISSPLTSFTRVAFAHVYAHLDLNDIWD